MFFQKQNKYKMNPDIANHTLQNVFAACDRESNATPFDKLILRKRANTRVYDRLILLTSLFLLLTFLAPLFIVPVSTMLGKRTDSESPALVRDYVEDSCLYLELKLSMRKHTLKRQMERSFPFYPLTERPKRFASPMWTMQSPISIFPSEAATRFISCFRLNETLLRMQCHREKVCKTKG